MPCKYMNSCYHYSINFAPQQGENKIFILLLTSQCQDLKLLHCSLWKLSGALFSFSRALFCMLGVKSPGAPVYFSPAAHAYQWRLYILSVDQVAVLGHVS